MSSTVHIHTVCCTTQYGKATCGNPAPIFFKQKTAYEISECDWSSDVCSSD
eukprot:COSAG02_NODE_52937_length_305_cov_0.466019_1_plen_50_part_01